MSIENEELVRAIFMKLGDVEEGSSYGTLAFRVKKILLARLHQDGEHLVLKVGYDAKEALLDLGSKTFTTTPHYDGTDYVLIELAKMKSRDAQAAVREAHAQLSTPAKTSSKRATRKPAPKKSAPRASRKR